MRCPCFFDCMLYFHHWLEGDKEYISVFAEDTDIISGEGENIVDLFSDTDTETVILSEYQRIHSAPFRCDSVSWVHIFCTIEDSPWGQAVTFSSDSSRYAPAYYILTVIYRNSWKEFKGTSPYSGNRYTGMPFICQRFLVEKWSHSRKLGTWNCVAISVECWVNL